MGTLGILEKMSQDNNKELKLSPLSNVVSAQSGKDGWGTVTIAMPNEIIGNLAIDKNYYVGGLIVAKRTEFNKYKE